MQQTRAWLYAFKRAFEVSYDSPPPPNDEDMLDLLQLADERLSENDADNEDPPPKTKSPPKPSRH